MGCTQLTILGGVFEIFGFGLIAWELARVQRRELGTPKFLIWVAQRVQSVGDLFRRPVQRGVTLRAGGTAGGSVSVHGRERAGEPGDSIEVRISALERNFGFLEREFDERANELKDGLIEVRQEVRNLRAEFDSERERREQDRKESLRTSIAVQGLGTVLFVAGAVLSVVGNTVYR